MRRHYRNHARPGFSRANAPNTKSIRRRMEQISASTLALVGVGSRALTSAAGLDHAERLSSSLHTNASDDSGGENSYDADGRMRSESLESDSEQDPYEPMDDVEAHDSDNKPFVPTRQVEHDPESTRLHEITPPRFHSRSPKHCNPSHLQHADSSGVTKQIYSCPNSYTPSSAVYLHSCTDLNVSTVLRPAFNKRTVKEGLVW